MIKKLLFSIFIFSSISYAIMQESIVRIDNKINAVNKYGDTLQGNIDANSKNITSIGTLGATTANLTNITATTLGVGAITSTGKLSLNYLENAAATDGTRYYSFITTGSVSAGAAAEVTGLYSAYDWYTGDNANNVFAAIEGVFRSKAADESITGRGVYGRFYIDPTNPSSTLRTGIGGEFSARAGYSGANITAESGTAFVGMRSWMAPYFTNTSTTNINNFHGLWIYNEHPTIAVTNGIFLSNAASGGYTNGLNLNGSNIYGNDIVLQNGEYFHNKTDGDIVASGHLKNDNYGIQTTSLNVTNIYPQVQNGGITLGGGGATALTLTGNLAIPYSSSLYLGTSGDYSRFVDEGSNLLIDPKNDVVNIYGAGWATINCGTIGINNGINITADISSLKTSTFELNIATDSIRIDFRNDPTKSYEIGLDGYGVGNYTTYISSSGVKWYQYVTHDGVVTTSTSKP